MGLAVACGSVFLGVATAAGWGLWHLLPRLSLSARRRRMLRARLTKQRRAVVSQPYGQLGRRLLKAGYRSPHAAVIIILERVLAVVASGVVAWLGFQGGMSLKDVSLAALGTLAVGWFLPEWWLRGRVQMRVREVNRYLPDMLDLMVVCLEAGLGFNATMVRVADELQWTSAVLHEELQFTIREIQMGRLRSVALRNLGKRCGHEEFNALIAVIIQAEKFGMSLAKTLRTQVEGMRTARRQRVQEIVHKMPVKMAFPLVFFIFPELLVVMIGPAVIHIWVYYLKGGIN